MIHNMKIAFIVQSFPKLSERFVIDQIVELIKFGHQVSIYAINNPREPYVHDDIAKHALMENTYYIPTRPKSKLLLRTKTIALLLKHFPRKPYVLFKSISNLLSNGFDYEKLYYSMIFPAKTFDIVHCHFGPAGKIGAFLKRINLCKHLIVTFHGYDVTSYTNNKDNVYDEVFKLADRFTYNSIATKEKLIELGCPLERMCQIPMGINLRGVEFKIRTPKAGDCIRLLSVGRLVEMKGRDYLIDAFAELEKKHSNIQLDIVGDGELREHLENKIEELALSSKITIHGWVDDEQLEQLYNKCHIFVHPSVTQSDGNMEGQGVVLVEAQARGIPIVATRHNAFPETAPDGIVGYLVEERDSNALYRKLDYLIENPSKWEYFGNNGKKNAKKYDITTITNNLLQLYEEIKKGEM